MDENTTKLLDNPHQSSRKTLYLLLVLLLVVAVSGLTLLKNRTDVDLADDEVTVTPEEQMRRLAETPSTGTNPSSAEQARRLKESPSTNESAKEMTYEEQLEILKNN